MTEDHPARSPELEQCIEDALDALDRYRVGWFEALRQDAVETFPRLSRWRQCHIGCRVPVMDMVVRPLRRNLTTVAESFMNEAARVLAAETGGSAPTLELAGRGIDLRLQLEPSEVDFVFKRGWIQGIIQARRQFEHDMMAHVENVYQVRIRAHLSALLDAIIEAMEAYDSSSVSTAEPFVGGG